jgi:hypothetical protein
VPYVPEIGEKRGRRDHQPHGEKPALRPLLMARHLPETDRHQKRCQHGEDGERRETVAIDPPARPHVPPRGAGRGERKHSGRDEPERKARANQCGTPKTLWTYTRQEDVILRTLTMSEAKGKGTKNPVDISRGTAIPVFLPEICPCIAYVEFLWILPLRFAQGQNDLFLIG